MARIGIIKEISGVAKSVGTDGSSKTLAIGDIINEGEVVLTEGSTSSVKLSFDSGKELILGGDERTLLDDSVVSSEAFNNADVQAEQAALLDGGALPEAAAAAGDGLPDGVGGFNEAFVAGRDDGRGDVGTYNLGTDGLGAAALNAEDPGQRLFAPTISIDLIDAAVYESGLENGTGTLPDGIDAVGTFTIADLNGLTDIQTLSIGGTIFPIGGNVDNFSAIVGQTILTEHGEVTITSFEAGANGQSGTFGYEYTLTESTTDAPNEIETDGFELVVSDGTFEASATVTVEIVDDVPVIENTVGVIHDESVGPFIYESNEGRGRDGRFTDNNVDADDIFTHLIPHHAGIPIDMIGLAASELAPMFYNAGADGLANVALTDNNGNDFNSYNSGLTTTQSGETIYLYTVTAELLSKFGFDVGDENFNLIGDNFVLGLTLQNVDFDELLEPSQYSEEEASSILSNIAFVVGLHEGNSDASVDDSLFVLQLQAISHSDIQNHNDDEIIDAIHVTVTDGDGDIVTSDEPVTITFRDDGPTIPGFNIPQFTPRNAEFDEGSESQIPYTHVDNRLVVADEDNLLDGNNDVQSGDDFQRHLEGRLSHNYGADGPGSISFESMHEVRADFTSNGYSVSYVWNSEASTLSAVADDEGNSEVFIVVINPITGQYNFTLLDNVDHPEGIRRTDDTENPNINLSLTYTVTDGDGDSVAGELRVLIDDDIPTIPGTENNNEKHVDNVGVHLDDDALIGGNPGGLGDDIDAKHLTGTLSHSYGADGAGSLLLTDEGAPNGFVYSLNDDGTLLTISQEGTAVMSVLLTDTASGAYTVTQLAPIAHSEGNNENNAKFKITYEVTDGDGDTVEGSIKIHVDDDTPVILATQPEPFAFDITNHDYESSAGYNSSYGYYVKGEGGVPTTGFIIWDGVHDNDATSFQLNGYSQDEIGFFIIPNGNNLNPNLDDETPVTFEFVDGQWQAFIGDTAIVGKGSHVLFDNASLNLDGQPHIIDSPLNGNQNWEDLQIPNGDGDFNDVNTNVASNGGVVPLMVDESDIDLTSEPKEFPSDTINLSSFFNISFGADGPADSNSTMYNLNLAQEDVDSGLVDSLTDNTVLLRMNGSTVEGYFADSSGDVVVFSLSADYNANVTLTQYRSVMHDDPNDPNEATSAAVISDGLILLSALAVDGDGDVVTSDGIDISALVTFRDDGPVAMAEVESLDEDGVIYIDVLTNDNAGADGYSDTPISITTNPLFGMAEVVGSQIKYTPNENYSGEDVVEYTITDRDGDTSTSSVTINVTPVADAPTLSMSVSDPTLHAEEIDYDLYTYQGDSYFVSNSSELKSSTGNTEPVFVLSKGYGIDGSGNSDSDSIDKNETLMFDLKENTSNISFDISIVSPSIDGEWIAYTSDGTIAGRGDITNQSSIDISGIGDFRYVAFDADTPGQPSNTEGFYVLPSGTMPQNLILNGSFEDISTVTNGISDNNDYDIPAGSLVNREEMPGWKLVDTDMPDMEPHHKNHAGVGSTDGDNYMDLGASPGNSSIYQNVSGLTDGDSYTLSFDYRDKAAMQESGRSGRNSGKTRVFWNGEEIAEFSGNNKNEWKSKEFEVVANSALGNRLVFEEFGVANDNWGMAIDNVEMYKPTSYYVSNSYSYDLDINAGLTDIDTSEILSSATLSNLPSGIKLYADGVEVNGVDGKYTVELTDTVTVESDVEVDLGSVIISIASTEQYYLNAPNDTSDDIAITTVVSDDIEGDTEIIMGSGNDHLIVGDDIQGNATVDMGAGNDIVEFTGEYDPSDSNGRIEGSSNVDFGLGEDTLILDGGASMLNLENIENLEIVKLNGSNLTDEITVVDVFNATSPSIDGVHELTITGDGTAKIDDADWSLDTLQSTSAVEVYVASFSGGVDNVILRIDVDISDVI